jgi:long-chain acyl-CoA synthetase
MNQPSRLFDFLHLQQDRFPKKDMLNAKENGQWFSFSTSEVAETVDRLSMGLLQLGLSGRNMNVEDQDKIAIISRNRPEWLMLDLATQQIGVLLCPIYPTTHVNEIEFIFNDAGIKYVFVSGQELYDKVCSIRTKVPSLINIFSFDETEESASWKSLLSEKKQPDQELINWRNSIQTEHCATIIYTSGTTGVPKGVMLSHQNLVSNVINATTSFPFPQMPSASALSFLPLNHIFERIASYIYISTGISIYYAENLDTIGENLKEVKPVLFTTVPRLLEKMYDKIMKKGSELKGLKRKLFFWSVALAEKYDNRISGGWWYNLKLALANALVFKKWRAALGGNLQYIITGGAACQERLLRIFNAARIPVYEGYGPTENSPVISVNCRKKGGTMFGTVGLVIDGQEVKLESDGEICVKGPSVMMGYYKRPDLTAETIINGWLHTGDIGTFVEGKYLKITDRKKEMFKTSGGKYVAPMPIENKLKESPFIEQAMIIGADRKFVSALIVPSFENLITWMNDSGIAYSNNKEAVSNASVLAHYDKIIGEFNLHFNHVEQIRKFCLLNTEWGVESGELTPKLSLRRKVIAEKYKDSLEQVYKV